MTKPGEKELDNGYLVDHVTHPNSRRGNIHIIGVRALIAFDNQAFGVLEINGEALVFFHVDAPYGTGINATFKVFAEKPANFLIENLKQEHLFRSPDNSVLFTGTKSPHDGFAYAGKIEDNLSSVSKMFRADFMPDLTPFGIFANDSQLVWGTYGIDSVTSEPILYFMTLANDSTMSAATPICLFEYAHSSGKTNGSVFTP